MTQANQLINQACTSQLSNKETYRCGRSFTNHMALWQLASTDLVKLDSSPYHITTCDAMSINGATHRMLKNVPNFADAIDEKYGAPVQLHPVCQTAIHLRCLSNEKHNVLKAASNNSDTSLLSYMPLLATSSMRFKQCSLESRGDEPLWNLSSRGGTIRRTLLNSAFEEVDTCTGSMMDSTVLQGRFPIKMKLDLSTALIER